MKTYLIEYKDIFDICERIKEIKPSYLLMYNQKQNRFEVHDKMQEGDTFCVIAERIDDTLIEKLQRTRREVVDKLILEIEETNEKIEKDNICKIKDKVLGDIK